MSELSPSRYCWSWLSCFVNVKHKKNKNKKQQNHHLKQNNLANDHTNEKYSPNVDENSNIIMEFDSSSETIITNEHSPNFVLNGYQMTYVNEKSLVHSDNIQETADDINSTITNQKSLLTIRPTQLDAIVEDSNEENSDDIDETIPCVRSYCDRELISDSTALYTRLFDLSKMNHFILQFNDHGCFLGEFTRYLGKFKLKIDDIKRTSAEIPRDAELLEAKYSTLLATIESLSLLLKFVHLSSHRFSINRLIFSIEQRMEQLNKLIQLSSSISMSRKQYDLIDDDFLSFRSALSSYEHLLTITS